MTTTLQPGVNPYAEFERLVAIASAHALPFSERDIDKLCEDGPEDATARIRVVMSVRGILASEAAGVAPPPTSSKATQKPGAPKDGDQATTTPGGFVSIPHLLIDRLLPAMPGAVLKVYCALLRFEGYRSGQMWPGQNRLAEMTGLGQRQVCTSIATLREVGLIKTRRRWGTSNMYERVPVTADNCDAILDALRKRRPSRRAPKKATRAHSPENKPTT
jgi:hypothetical protein